MEKKVVSIDDKNGTKEILSSLKEGLIDKYLGANQSLINLEHILFKYEGDISLIGVFLSNLYINNKAGIVITKFRERIFSLIKQIMTQTALLDSKPEFMQAFMKNLLYVKNKEAFIYFVKSINEGMEKEDHSCIFMLRILFTQLNNYKDFHNSYNIILASIITLDKNSRYIALIKQIPKSEDILKYKKLDSEADSKFLRRYAFDFIMDHVEKIELDNVFKKDLTLGTTETYSRILSDDEFYLDLEY